MARITRSEYNLAQQNNIEKLNGDYFLKTIQADAEGNFITPCALAEYNEIAGLQSRIDLLKLLRKKGRASRMVEDVDGNETESSWCCRCRNYLRWQRRRRL